MRNDCDPYELAAQSEAAGPPVGWGPHTYTDEILCQLGEAIDKVVYVLVRANGGEPPDPLPWRRPGVLGVAEREALAVEESAPMREQLEAERAEREAARAARRAQQAAAAAEAAAQPPTSPQV